MRRPCHRIERAAFAPSPKILCELLQHRENPPLIGQRCADLAPGSADRSHRVACPDRGASSPVRPNLTFQYTQVEPKAPWDAYGRDAAIDGEPMDAYGRDAHGCTPMNAADELGRDSGGLVEPAEQREFAIVSSPWAGRNNKASLRQTFTARSSGVKRFDQATEMVTGAVLAQEPNGLERPEKKRIGGASQRTR